MDPGPRALSELSLSLVLPSAPPSQTRGDGDIQKARWSAGISDAERSGQWWYLPFLDAVGGGCAQSRGLNNFPGYGVVPPGVGNSAVFVNTEVVSL